MKPVRHMAWRFAASLAAYAAFFLKPRYLPADAWQEFTASLFVVAFVFAIRGPKIGQRMAALFIMLPPVLWLAMFLYGTIPELIRFGHRIYADA